MGACLTGPTFQERGPGCADRSVLKPRVGKSAAQCAKSAAALAAAVAEGWGAQRSAASAASTAM